jgi:hypothetical protein
VAETNRPSCLTSPHSPLTAEEPGWAELLQEQAQLPPQERPVWTAPAREDRCSLFGPATCPVNFHPLPTFYRCLGEKLEQAKRHGQPVAVIVLKLPALGPLERLREREMEIGLLQQVRGEDLPVRLSPTTLAVALPHIGAHASVVALRLRRVLSSVVGGRVDVGTAWFPADGSTALELLRAATGRILTAVPGSQLDPELTRLLGPIGPTGAQQPSR